MAIAPRPPVNLYRPPEHKAAPTAERLPRGPVLRSPEAVVKWCLKWVLAPLPPLSSATAADRIRAWDVLMRLRTLRGETPTRALPHEMGIEEAHTALGTCIRALARGERYDLLVPEGIWSFNPPERRAGARQSRVVTRTLNGGSASAMAVLAITAFVDNLNSYGADRLRQCPPLRVEGRVLVPDPYAPPCGRIFLARRGQVFCCREHSSAAAWARFEPTRKENRDRPPKRRRLRAVARRTARP